MMDEYIPSPRHTPNKPRRMRDVSAIYPVNEKQLLLEAIMKQQRESPSCEVAGVVDPPAMAEDSDAVDLPPLHPSPSPWRDKRTCPVCHWTTGGGGSSSSSSSGTSEYDGDESDASSACKDCKSPCALVGGASSTSSSEDDDEDNGVEEAKEEDSLDGDGGIEEEEDEEAEEEDEEEDSGVRKSEEGEDKQQHQRQTTTRYFGEQGYDSIRKGVRLPKTLDRGHCLLGREVLTAPGKLLYGRHSIYYRGAALFQPQGRN